MVEATFRSKYVHFLWCRRRLLAQHLHESGADKSTVFILNDLRKIEMIDGGMRMNPYIHDRKNGASLFRNERIASQFFSGKN